MKSLTLELQTGKKKVHIPESWDEINLETFTRIENEFGYDFSKMITLFSILTGVPIAPIEKSEQPNLDVQLFTMMQYVSQPPKWEDLEKPKKLTIKGKVVKCRYDFRTTSLGQKLTMSSLIRDKPNPIDAIPEVIAIFLQPTIDCEYNRDKSQELIPEIMKLNCKDAFGYAQFFFSSLEDLKRYGLKDSVTRRTRRPRMPAWQEINASYLSLN
ncbi:MAG: hypothetical protein KAR20_18235 [Candidatus Heimdallarchaeota archaeon]|nr:hypothetical protein [Candidatus Heimdallarchaeota archaeon]